MRCPKCGYISFDHLDSCKKCGKDTAEVRQTLNLLDFEPNVPFLLGALVGEMHGGGGGRARETLSLTQETDLDFGGLDTDVSSTMEQTLDIGDLDESIDRAAAEDLELSELAMDDMDLDSAGSAGAELSLDDLEGDLDETSTPDADEGFMGLELDMEEGGAGEEPTEEESALELDLSDDDLSELAQTLEGQLASEIGGGREGGAEDPASELEDVILEMEEESKK